MSLIRSPTRNVSQSENISSQNTYPSLPLHSLDSVNRSQLDLEIHAASVKLPQFWTYCPDAWFIHAEIQFATKGITLDRTKYEYIITALPQEVIVTVLDLIQNPPVTDLYNSLKKALVERHSLSETSRLEKILSDSEMGGRKPSEFFRSLNLLAGTSFGPDILKKLWLRKLPKSLNIALTASNHSDINEMIQLADRIWEVMFNGEITSIKENPTSNIEKIVETLTKSLCENINKLSIEVCSLKSEIRERQSRQSFRGNSKNNSRSRFRSPSKNWLCRFHYRYGHKAIKCEQPCSFSQSESSSN